MNTSNPNPLEQLFLLERSSPEFNDKISSILHGAEYKGWVKRIQEDDVVEFVDFLDNALDVLDPAGSGFRRCLRELRRMCGSKLILPTSYKFPQDLTVGPQPVASGGSGDVYQGTLNGSRVCVKRVRVYVKDGPENATKTLYQEAAVWKRLKHENIVPLLSVTITPLQLVSEWMSGGDLTEYIGRHPNRNRLPLVSGIAQGLSYLHSYSIVHGDLKGPNVLVDESGRARITDFGVTTVTQSLDSIRSVSDDNAHTARWTAPEILNEAGTHSKEADVFSFAMVMVEAFTGAVPFKDRLPAAAMLAIMDGRRPAQPTHPAFTSHLWALMQRCWDQDPHSRPEVSEILEVLNGTAPLSPKLYSIIGSSSSLTIAQQPQFAALSKSAALHSPSLSGTTPSASRYTHNSSHMSEYSSPSTSVNHGGDMGVLGSQQTRLHGSSQATLQNPTSSADRHRGQHEHSSKEMSRNNTNASEASPQLLQDPYTYDVEQAEQFHDQTGGIGMPHVNTSAAVGDRNGSTREFGEEATRLDRGNNGTGEYWGGESGRNRGASRSTVRTGDDVGDEKPSRRPRAVNGHTIGTESHNQSQPALEGKNPAESQTRAMNGNHADSKEPTPQNSPQKEGWWSRFKSRFKSLFRRRKGT